MAPTHCHRRGWEFGAEIHDVRYGTDPSDISSLGSVGLLGTCCLKALEAQLASGAINVSACRWALNSPHRFMHAKFAHVAKRHRRAGGLAPLVARPEMRQAIRYSRGFRSRRTEPLSNRSVSGG